MISTPPIVNEAGNISIHNREGARLSVFFETELGVARTMTGLTVAMLLATSPVRRLVLNDGAVLNEKVWIIAPEQFADLIDKRIDFALRDESTTDMPIIWRGYILVQGF